MHQLSRLRLAKNLPDVEAELIVRTISENIRTYEQVVEVRRSLSARRRTRSFIRCHCQLLAHLPPFVGGLLPLSFCLFHQQESVREATVDIFNELRAYPVTCSISAVPHCNSCRHPGRCDIPASSQSLPALRLRATSPRSGVSRQRGRTERQSPRPSTSACLAHALQSK